MFAPETIRDMQLEAAAKASREGRIPLVLWEPGDITAVPFLGTFIPQGWQKYTGNADPSVRLPLFVDGTGLDRDGPAMHYTVAGQEAEDLSHRAALQGLTIGWAIVEAGQFQVYIDAYVKMDGAPGVPADESLGICDKCGEDDGVLDYHECDVDDELADDDFNDLVDEAQEDLGL